MHASACSSQGDDVVDDPKKVGRTASDSLKPGIMAVPGTNLT